MKCKSCVMPSTRPDHTFADGECPACINHRNRPTIDWESRYKELEKLLDRFHGEVLVPSSGGKDSSYQCIRLKEMGAHVTAVTAMTCYLTDVGQKNINNLARHVKTIVYVPNMTVRAKLNRLGLELVGDISWPEHAAIFSTPFRASKELNLPLIMYGENPQNQYGGPMGSEESKLMTIRWIHEFGGFLGLRPSDFVGMEGITEHDMKDYMLPFEEREVKSALINYMYEAHFLGQYIPWDSHANARVAKEHGMMQQLPYIGNWWDHENLDNAQTGIHDYFMLLKYGYSRADSQLSVDVRNGLLTREKALEISESLNKHFPYEYGGVTFETILDHIGMTEKYFWEIAEQHRAI